MMQKSSAVQLPAPGKPELDHINVMSRPQVIDAYRAWSTLSYGEKLCITEFVSDNARVLDLGCGTGRLLRALYRTGIDYVGIDNSAEMIQAAQEENPWANFRKDDITNLEFSYDSFDVIALLNNVIDALYPFQRRIALLGKCHDWLTHDGVLICSSHLVHGGQTPGYFEEEYHEATLLNYRTSTSALIDEIEERGFDIQLVVRDYRNGLCDWVYVVASKRSEGGE